MSHSCKSNFESLVDVGAVQYLLLLLTVWSDCCCFCREINETYGEARKTLIYGPFTIKTDSVLLKYF